MSKKKSKKKSKKDPLIDLVSQLVLEGTLAETRKAEAFKVFWERMKRLAKKKRRVN